MQGQLIVAFCCGLMIGLLLLVGLVAWANYRPIDLEMGGYLLFFDVFIGPLPEMPELPPSVLRRAC